MVQPRLNGAGDGHGPHAEQQGGVHKPLGEASPVLSPGNFGPEQIPGLLQAAFDVQGVSQRRPQRHAHNDAQHILGADEVADPHSQHAQAQRLGQDGRQPLADQVLEQQSHRAPRQHQDHVDEGG